MSRNLKAKTRLVAMPHCEWFMHSMSPIGVSESHSANLGGIAQQYTTGLIASQTQIT